MAQFYVIVLGHGISQRRGHDGFNGYRVFGHGAFFLTAGADVVEEQHAHLVAGNQLIGAVRALHGDAHAVSIRVGGEHQICALFLGQFHAFFHRGEDFRVRIGAGREIAVGVFLFRHNRDIINADIAQHAGNGYQAGAVKRAVDELQASRLAEAGTNLAGLDVFIQAFLAVFPDKLDETFFHAFGKRHIFCTREHIGFLNGVIYDVCGIVRHLAAVRAVGFVAVVLGRVVAGRHHDAGIGLIEAGGKRKGGYRHGLVVNAHVDAIGGQDTGSFFSKGPAFKTGIVADGHRLRAAFTFYPIGYALRGLTHNPDVHAIRAGT